MGALRYEDIRDEVLKWPENERLRLFAEVLSDSTPSNDEPFSDEEIATMLAEVGSEPLTGAEIVARGVLGGWADMEIEDGAAWVNEQKLKRRNKNQW